MTNSLFKFVPPQPTYLDEFSAFSQLPTRGKTPVPPTSSSQARLAGSADTTPLGMMQRASIMLIDDEEITLEVIQMFLEDAGYERFIQTPDSREAFATLERERPDLVLLDLMMPHVSGFDILQAIRSDERFKFLPVVVLTSSTDGPTKLKALEMGATDFLAKPVDQSELVLRVRNTLAAKAYQDRLAYIDRLTGLPNRHMLLDRLEWAMEHARRYGQNGALLHIDVDRFSELNEALGPARADTLLQHVATRLHDAARSSDVMTMLKACESSGGLGRLGGDEFVLLLLGELTPDCTVRVAKRLLKAMAEPFRIGDQELYVSVSIGIATFPDDGVDIDTVQHNAAIAVRALQDGQHNAHGAFQFYSEDLNKETLDRLDLETELRRALERKEFELFYQPQYDVATTAIVGAEGLVRWHHPERGYVSPLEFIPLAEDIGLIDRIGRCVLETGCRQLCAWLEQGLDPGVLSINVSVHQFREPGFVDTVRDTLARAGVPAARIKLEITESLIVSHAERTTEMLEALREIGVKLSIDDFGTGYSSLSYLRRLPIDELKIDRSFLADVETSADSAAIVRAILALAHGLDLSVTAEGVETPGQLAFLDAHRCASFQGFYFSKPVPAADFGAMLAQAAAGIAPTPASA